MEDPRGHARRTGGTMRVALRGAIPRPLRRALAWLDLKVQELFQRGFERWYGIDTSGHAYLDELGVQGEGRAFYEGIAWLPLRRALRSLRPGPDDVFVDIGSGRGQALVVAGQLPLRRVIGVAGRAAHAGRRAQRRPRAREAARARLRARDGRRARLGGPRRPEHRVHVLPFTGDVFEQAMQRVFDSYDRNPREMHILYAYPWEHNKLLGTGCVEVVDVRGAHFPARPWWPWSAWVIPVYRVLPEGATRNGGPRLAGGPLRRAAIRRWSAPTDQRFALYRPGEGLIFEL